jgi:hypothetical protein
VARTYPCAENGGDGVHGDPFRDSGEVIGVRDAPLKKEKREEGKKKKKEERISWTIRIRSDLQREDEGTKTDLLERAIDAEAVVLGLRAVGLEEEGEVRKSAFQARDASNEEGEMSN